MIVLAIVLGVLFLIGVIIFCLAMVKAGSYYDDVPKGDDADVTNTP